MRTCSNGRAGFWVVQRTPTALKALKDLMDCPEKVRPLLNIGSRLRAKHRIRLARSTRKNGRTSRAPSANSYALGASPVCCLRFQARLLTRSLSLVEWEDFIIAPCNDANGYAAYEHCKGRIIQHRWFNKAQAIVEIKALLADAALSMINDAMAGEELLELVRLSFFSLQCAYRRMRTALRRARSITIRGGRTAGRAVTL